MTRLRVIGLAGLVSLTAWSCGSSSSPTAPSPTPTPTPQALTLSGGVSETAPTASNKIPGASVMIADGSNAGKSAIADGAGNFSIGNLQAGSFTVNVSASGYQNKGFPVTLTGSSSQTFQLAPVFRLLDNQLEDDVSGGSPVCQDFFSTSALPCKQYPIPVHNSGRLTAVLTWTRPSLFSGNDLELALLKDPRRNPEDRLAIARDIFVTSQTISSDVSAGTMYWIHVLYGGGSTVQHFTLRVTRPN